MKLRYLEVVTADVDAVCAAYTAAQGLRFGPPEPALGQARTATLEGGARIGVRAPLRESESPVIRPYWSVADLAAAVAALAGTGAEIAVAAMDLPGHGRIAIARQGGVEHGLWQD